LPDVLPDNTVVIDVGGHIGSFSMLALDRGAAKVLTYEAEPHNHLMCAANLRYAEDRSRLYNIAVWHKNTVRNYAYPHDAVNTGGGNVWSTSADERHATVTSLTLDNILRGYEPIVKDGLCNIILKLDCEGSEYPILYASKLLPIVSEIYGEFHPMDNPPDDMVEEGWPKFNHNGLSTYLSEWFDVTMKPTVQGFGHFYAKRK